MNLTCHSDIGKIKLLFIKNVQQAFISETHIDQYWQALNYACKPDLNNAIKEYASFEALLKIRYEPKLLLHRPKI